MKFENLILEVAEGVGVLMVNRPHVLNALSIETVRELGDAIEHVEKNGEIKGLIITGSGEKSFIAGADITELYPLDQDGARAYAARGQAVLNSIEQLPKPVIAAVNGFALGGGCELAMACHIRIAAENALFGQPEVKLGVIPGYGGTQRLARLVGKGRAMEICMTGGNIDATEALRIGLVNAVVPQAELMDTAGKMLGKILKQGPAAVALVIQAINEGLEGTQHEGLALEAELFGRCATTGDWKEGTKAFIEKRKPEFTGK